MSSLELTQDQKRTTGSVPPASVGSTMTVVGTNLYLYAGRLVSTRQMTADIYSLDFKTLVWTKLDISGPLRPKPRYFHSANALGSAIVIFGGMSSISGTEEICVLNDVAIFDTVAKQWHICDTPEGELLQPRYAHLSSISAGKLVVIGGQNKDNEYLLDAGVFDLNKQSWDKIYPIEGQYGAYRSLTVTSTRMDDTYPTDIATEVPTVDHPYLITNSSPVSSRSSWNGSIKTSTTVHDLSAARRPSATSASIMPASPVRQRPNLRKKSEVGGLIEKTETKPITGPAHPIYLYSNFNFVNVERHLHLIEPPKDTFSMLDKSALIHGSALPPGLRFPSGAIIGNHLLISGTYLTNSSQLFAIWAMNLNTSQWTRIDVCDRLLPGSWNKGLYCHALGQFFLLGHRDRSLVEDYNHRQVNFDHVTQLDLESFGIFEPAPQTMSSLAQQFGRMAMSDRALCDMELLTRDQGLVAASSRILAQKWPDYQTVIKERISSSQQLATEGHMNASSTSLASKRFSGSSSKHSVPYGNKQESRLKCMLIPYSHAVTRILVTFFYTDELPDTMEPDVPLLCQVLIVCAAVDGSHRNPHLTRLARLCRLQLHARMDAKNVRTIHEVAALTGHDSLQANAARLMAQQQQQQCTKPAEKA